MGESEQVTLRDIRTTNEPTLWTPSHAMGAVGGIDPGMLGAWLAEVRQRTGSARTETEYRRYLRRFVAMLGDRPLLGATPADCLTFAYARLPDDRRGGSLGKEPGPAAVSVRLAAVRSFFDFAGRMGCVDRNPADQVKRPRLPQPQPRGLDGDEARALLAAMPATAAGDRDRAIVTLMLLVGLRRVEVLTLTAGAIDPAGPALTWQAKGGVVRRRELPAPALAAIDAHLRRSGQTLAAMPPTARLFAISATGFAKNLRVYGRAIGRDDLTAHQLRHSAAKLRRRTGASLEDVQTLLGHSSVATTARYLQRIEGEHDSGWRAAAAVLGLES